MDKFDKLMRSNMIQKGRHAKLEPTNLCVSDPELAGYLAGSLDRAKTAQIEKHISECLLCLDRLVSASDGERLFNKRKLKAPARHVTWKAKNVDRITDDIITDRIEGALHTKEIPSRTHKMIATESAVKNWLPKGLKKNRWLIASITAFMLSFAFPPVFIQFLLAAGILGGKWIFDSENARTLIMIYNAWKKGGEKEVKDMLQTLKDRIPDKK